MDRKIFRARRIGLESVAGIGEQLGHAVISWAREQNARLLVLETNRKLDGAIRLYERLGFKHATPSVPSVYARADVYMELALSHAEAT